MMFYMMFLVLGTPFKAMTKAWLVSLGKDNIPFHIYSKTCLSFVPISKANGDAVLRLAFLDRLLLTH